MNQNTTYVLNPEYYFVNDINRIVVANEDLKISFIHPLHAVILSYFDDNTDVPIKDKIHIISSKLNIDYKDIKTFVSMLINNKDDIVISINNQFSSLFPANILIKKTADYKERGYEPSTFLLNSFYDNTTLRLNKPIEMTIVINTQCVTDCVYCYANRKFHYSKNKLSTQRLIEIIDEAKSLQMINVEITGGELFLEKDYLKVLTALLKNNFSPKISTKIPLTEKQIIELSEIGLTSLQFSVDSLDQNIMEKTLKVGKNYLKNLLQSISLCAKYNIKVKINTIITKYNCDYKIISNLLSYLLKYNHVYEITLGYAGYSINNTHNYFTDIAPSYGGLNVLLNKVKHEYKNEKRLMVSGIEMLADNYKFQKNIFFNKAVCTGNLFQFYLLPDGKVTLCEEMYWHPKFIIGDLTNQSIMEMWHGKQALALYNIGREAFSKDSACKTCKDFDYCHKNASVCWKEVLETFGTENWDYPDPRCMHAPAVENHKYLS